MSVWRRALAYFDASEPRAFLGLRTALIVAGNQPFYPLYVWWIAGGKAWPALLTWLSTPLFLAVPALWRRDPGHGRAALMAATIGNTGVCALALGPATGVEWFYAPCLLLAALVSPQGRRLMSVAASAVAVIVLVFLARWHGAGLVSFDAAELSSLTTLHLVSVVGITAMILWFGRGQLFAK